jgi:hypothetical protein
MVRGPSENGLSRHRPAADDWRSSRQTDQPGRPFSLGPRIVDGWSVGGDGGARRCHARKRRASEALRLKQAVNLFQQTRANLRQLDFSTQRAYVDARVEVYRDLAEILIADGRLPEARCSTSSRHTNSSTSCGATARRIKGAGRPDAAGGGVANALQRDRDRVAAIGGERGELIAIARRTPAEERRFESLERDLSVAGEAFSQFLDQVAADLDRGPDAPGSSSCKRRRV